ncbi:MAG: hypothetical protein FJ149_07565 [Euryarchaeota archaeon]|nr:hypothetical protein [Euryarchaeota archaeon]
MKLQRILALVLLVGLLLGYIVGPLFSFGKEPTVRLNAFPAEDQKNWEQLDQYQQLVGGMNDIEVLSIVGSPTILRDVKEPSGTLYIAVGIEKKYRAAEVSIIQDFVKKGGKVIVADDGGYADDLSNKYGVTFYGGTMWDKNYYLNNASFPMAPATLFLNKYWLVMSEPTGLANQSYEDPEKGEFQYLMISNGSVDSYVDRNNNKEVDPADAHENIPLILQVSYNTKVVKDAVTGGKIIFIADTSIFTDDMLISIDQLEQMGFTPLLDNNKNINLTEARGGSNRQFVVALINYLLPTGGTVVFDESRHPQSKYTAAVYDSLTTLTILTSNPLEASLLSVGILLILGVVVLRARDKESWIHRFDISSVHRRAFLPDTRAVQVDHLRRALLQKLRMLNSLSVEELNALSPAQKTNMIKDVALNELLMSTDRVYTPEEVRVLTQKLRAWGKA